MLLATVLVASAFAGYTNTTSFWGTLLSDNDMHFQVYSGYEEVDWFFPKETTGMFYNLFSAMGHKLGPNESSANVPLMIWLQGGPGASSQFGAFT